MGTDTYGITTADEDASDNANDSDDELREGCSTLMDAQ
jgi:hypothetical protein